MSDMLTIPTRYIEPLTIRALGDNITLTRSAWEELLDSLRPDSELARRIRNRLED